MLLVFTNKLENITAILLQTVNVFTLFFLVSKGRCVLIPDSTQEICTLIATEEKQFNRQVELNRQLKMLIKKSEESLFGKLFQLLQILLLHLFFLLRLPGIYRTEAKTSGQNGYF